MSAILYVSDYFLIPSSTFEGLLKDTGNFMIPDTYYQVAFPMVSANLKGMRVFR